MVKSDWLLDAKDTLLLAGCWNWACGIFAEEAVTVAGDAAIAKFPQEMGDEAESSGEDGIGAMKEVQGLVYGVGAAIEALIGGEGCCDEDDAFGRWCRGEGG